MGLRERIQREIHAAFRQASTQGGGRINVARRVNKVVVRNVGGGRAAASAEQDAPIVQQPGMPDDERSDEPD